MSTQSEKKGSTFDKTELHELFEKAMLDPTLFSTLDIDHLLESIEHDKNDYLENKSMRSISDEIYHYAKDLPVPVKTQLEYCQKLTGYRLVDDIHELHAGKHIRWIRKVSPFSLTNGGIVTNIKFLDNGTHVLCMSKGGRFIQCKFDECTIFQKMTLEEQLIMMAYDYLEKR
jgi:hypothetical protein